MELRWWRCAIRGNMFRIPRYKTYQLLVLVFLSVGVEIVACTAIENEQVSPIEPTKELLITPIGVSSPTATYAPTFIHLNPTPTSTSTATSTTATALPNPTWTPLPTIPPNQVEAEIENLLINPVNCNLPCWWGTVPGKSNWYEVERLLRTFTTEIRRYALTNDLVGYGVVVNIPEGINLTNQIGPFYTVNDRGIVKTIEVALGNLPNYSLSQVLTTYGPPSEVWLNTIDAPRAGSQPFRLLLFYKQQGFLIQYVTNASMIENLITGCFTNQGAQEDGARSIMDIATHFDWRENTRRLILFLGDEALEGGEQGVELDGAVDDGERAQGEGLVEQALDLALRVAAGVDDDDRRLLREALDDLHEPQPPATGTRVGRVGLAGL